MGKKEKISDKTIGRFPLYLNILNYLQQKGIKTLSSKSMSKLAMVKASQFRKDLSCFGEFGKQGIGYSVSHLIERISSIMHLNCKHRAILVGAGNLGKALTNFKGFKNWNFEIVKIYDNSPLKIGKKVGKLTIEDIDLLPVDLGINLGIIAVPIASAQKVADLLIGSKIKGILNFTGIKLNTPPSVIVRQVDLSHELAILNYYCCSEDN